MTDVILIRFLTVREISILRFIHFEHERMENAAPVLSVYVYR